MNDENKPKLIYFVGASASGKSLVSNYWQKAFPEYINTDDTCAVNEYIQIDRTILDADNPLTLKCELKKLLNHAKYAPNVIESYIKELEEKPDQLPKAKYCKRIDQNSFALLYRTVWDDGIVALAKQLNKNKKYIIQFARGHDEHYLKTFNIKCEEMYNRTFQLLHDSLDKELTYRLAIIHVSSELNVRRTRNDERRTTTGQNLPNEVLNTVFKDDLFTADYHSADLNNNLMYGSVKILDREIPVAKIINNQNISDDKISSYFASVSKDIMNYFVRNI